jgi:hypothetical protein
LPSNFPLYGVVRKICDRVAAGRARKNSVRHQDSPGFTSRRGRMIDCPSATPLSLVAQTARALAHERGLTEGRLS